MTALRLSVFPRDDLEAHDIVLYNKYRTRQPVFSKAAFGAGRTKPRESLTVSDLLAVRSAFKSKADKSSSYKYDGMITWTPPAIFKSSCPMDITFSLLTIKIVPEIWFLDLPRQS